MISSLSLPLLSRMLGAVSLVALSTACVSVYENVRSFSDDSLQTKLELRSFFIVPELAVQRLQWETNDELACAYFVVERQVGSAPFKVLAQVPGDPMAVTPRHHEFVDFAPAAESARYRLLQVDLDGLVHVGPALDAKLASAPMAAR